MCDRDILNLLVQLGAEVEDEAEDDDGETVGCQGDGPEESATKVETHHLQEHNQSHCREQLEREQGLQPLINGSLKTHKPCKRLL